MSAVVSSLNTIVDAAAFSATDKQRLSALVQASLLPFTASKWVPHTPQKRPPGSEWVTYAPFISTAVVASAGTDTTAIAWTRYRTVCSKRDRSIFILPDKQLVNC